MRLYCLGRVRVYYWMFVYTQHNSRPSTHFIQREQYKLITRILYNIHYTVLCIMLCWLNLDVICVDNSANALWNEMYIYSSRYAGFAGFQLLADDVR